MRSPDAIAVLLAFASLAGVAKADSLISNPNFTSTNATFPGYTTSTNNQISRCLFCSFTPALLRNLQAWCRTPFNKTVRPFQAICTPMQIRMKAMMRNTP